MKDGAAVDQAEGAANKRECGPCTACCDGWLRATIRGHEMQPGRPCQFRCDGGCRIYDERPDDPCREFACAWLQGEPGLTADLRPDRCGVIVLTGGQFGAWEVLELVPTGSKLPEQALEILKGVALERRIPLVINEFLPGGRGDYGRIRRQGFGPPAFAEAVREAVNPRDLWMRPAEMANG